MPWTGQQFKARHAHKLTDAQAEEAARIANAMLKSGADEGEAIATGIARAKHRSHSRKDKG